MESAMVASMRLCFLLAALSRAWLEAVAATPIERPPDVDFFVSPQGNDMWSGKLADPGESDGPFATLPRARDAIRERRMIPWFTPRQLVKESS
jgi:hypothetical protein